MMAHLSLPNIIRCSKLPMSSLKRNCTVEKQSYSNRSRVQLMDSSIFLSHKDTELERTKLVSPVKSRFDALYWHSLET